MFCRRPTPRLSRRTQSVSIELAQLETYLARNLFSWFDASRLVATSFVDRVALASEGALFPNARSVSASHAFAQVSAGGVTVAPSALFNGRPVATFTGTQRYASSIAAANWGFCHDGLGRTIWYVFASSNSTVAPQVVACTQSAQPGFDFFFNSPAAGSIRARVTNAGATNIIDSTIASVAPANTPVLVSQSYREASTPKHQHKVNGAVVDTTVPSGAPTVGAPHTTFTIGQMPSGTLGASMYLAEILIADRVDPTLTARAERYVSLKYGFFLT